MKLFWVILAGWVLVLTGCSNNEPKERQDKPVPNGDGIEVVYDTTEVCDSISLE